MPRQAESYCGRICNGLAVKITFGDEMSDKVKSGFLFADPSFLSGAARTLDLFGLYDRYNQSATPFEADLRALASDWLITGQDLGDAIDNFGEDAA